MTRKRLQDLVREEVQKASENETQSDRDSTNLKEINQSSPEDKAPAKSTKSPAINANSDRTESQNKIEDLTAALKSAEVRSIELQDRITSLEVELETQKNLVEKLQTELEQKNQVRQELETQQKLVAKLRTELKQVEEIQTEFAGQKQLIEKLYAELQKAQQQEAKTEKITSPQPITQNKSCYYSIIPRPIGRIVGNERSSSALSNEEIGWFD
jgi:chromosome segregation ATPase